MLLDACGVRWEDTYRGTNVQWEEFAAKIHENESPNYPVLFMPILKDCEDNVMVNQMSNIM